MHLVSLAAQLQLVPRHQTNVRWLNLLTHSMYPLLLMYAGRLPPQLLTRSQPLRPL